MESIKNNIIHHFNRQKICCLVRDTKIKLSPGRWLEVVENALNSPVHIIKQDTPKLTVRTFLAPWGEICLQDLKCGIKRQILSPLRPSRGRRAWRHSLSLIQQNFPITEPVLYMELKNGPFVTRTLTVTRWIESTNLGKTAEEKHLISEKFFLGLLKESTQLVARLHCTGYVHTDLKWGNFLWVPSQQRRIILTDLDHLEKSGGADKQGKDLARFILSAIEFQMGWEVAESLINYYFDCRKVRSTGIEKSLAKRIERKKSKYENRCLVNIRE
jgi:tRNA A-37 threonylcarbamoyl transferase component Bud32